MYGSGVDDEIQVALLAFGVIAPNVGTSGCLNLQVAARHSAIGARLPSSAGCDSLEEMS